MIENWNDKAEEKAEPSPSEQAQAADETLEARVIDALRGIYDPEIPVNIYDLGLIYELRINADGKVMIEMTLTAPGCPVAQTFPDTVKRAVKEVEGVSDARVELVWDPSWDPSRMSEAARLQLNLF
jgi:FeS assembly SUF system protein